jgi:hypothetical protein
MADHPEDRGPDVMEAHHSALISLHARSRPDGLPDPGLIPHFRRMGTGTALHTLADASVEEVPVSARLGALGDLARAGFPDLETAEDAYRELAGSVASLRSGVDAEQLLDDLKLATTEKVPFHTLQTGRSLPHHEAAFVGEDVCSVRTVRIGGISATWIFSEFETDAPFDRVAEWVDPHNWPSRGPMLFKAMDLVGSQRPVDLGPPGDVHWHGVFREEVQLVQRVRTLLHCDYWKDGDRAAGMTYDLSLSLDNEIDVDRGFLLVNNVGSVRRVKALKIVGFTNDIWDRVAAMVCPFWTDWVRGAVEDGGSSTPQTPGGDPADLTGRSPCVESGEAWIDFLGDSARTYLELFDGMSARIGSPDAKAIDFADDQRRLFSQLAKDWAKAWTFGLDTLSEVAREGLDAGFTPPDTPRDKARGAATTMTAAATAAAAEGTEGTVVPVTGLTPQDAPAVSDLVSIESGGARIPAASITTSVEALAQEGHGVRLQVKVAPWAPGLYVGQVTSRPSADPVPVQLYISQATGA